MYSASPSLNNAAKRTLSLATTYATSAGLPTIEPEHLLLALLNQPQTVAAKLLSDQRVDLNGLKRELAMPATSGGQAGTPTQSEAVRRAVLYAQKEAEHLKHRQIDALHLLLGLLYDDHGPTSDLLRRHDISLYELRSEIVRQPALFTAPVRTPLYMLVRPSPIFLLMLAVTLGCGVWLFFSPPPLLVQPLSVIFVLCGWVTSVCIHEFGHAVAAYLGGDDSVVYAGYLTLNPVKYTHPVLSVLLPLLFLLVGGVGLPGGAVYINRRALRSRWWETWTSAGGPIGTLLCLALLVWPFFFDWYAWVNDANLAFWPAIGVLAFLQVTALVFNLLPIPSLDGFGLIAPWLAMDIRANAYRFGQIILLLMLLILWQDSPLTDAFWSNMYGFADMLHIPGDLIDYGWSQFYG